MFGQGSFGQSQNNAPLYYGSLLETYKKIIESQRVKARPIIRVPDSRSFLKTNFFLDVEQANEANNTPFPSRSSIRPLEPTSQQNSPLSPLEKSLAANLAAMSHPSPSKPSQSSRRTETQLVRPKNSLPTHQWPEKRRNEDAESFLKIKKQPVRCKFSRIGALPITTVDAANVEYLQRLVKEIVKKQAPNFLEDEEVQSLVSDDESNDTSGDQEEETKKEEDEQPVIPEVTTEA